MPKSITCAALARSRETPSPIDVRRAPARAASGRTVSRSPRGEHGRVADRARALDGRTVVGFRGHGHEVGRGVDGRCIEGGFAAWQAGSNPVAAIGADA